VDPAHRRSYLAVLGGALACYAALGAVLRLLPHLALGSALLGLAVGAPALTAVLARPLGGRLGDGFGPRAVVLGGTLVMAAAGVPLLFGHPTGLLIASRLAAGAGEGVMMSAAVLWLLRLAGEGRRGRALGHIGLANYGGLTLGPLLTDALGHRPGAVFGAAVALPLAGGLPALALRSPQRPDGDPREVGARDLIALTLRPGLGLLLVNVGYVALLSFGTRAAQSHGVGAAGAFIPLFAATVIVMRTAGAAIPDRFGAARTLWFAAPVAAVGLAVAGTSRASVPAVAGVVVLAAGQALAVPALGLLALGRVPEARHGAAAGLFFAWFDAGVGLGGPAVGLLAGAAGPGGGLVGAAAAVACAAPVAYSSIPSLARSLTLRSKPPV
jgi:predicted MFS family arabinose efflux permease